MMPESHRFLGWQWPSLQSLRHFLVWSNTRGGNFEAYLGLSLLILAGYAIYQALRGHLSSELRKFTFLTFVSFVVSLGLKGGHLKDFVFPLLFLSILAAVGASAIPARAEKRKWLPASIVLLLLVDLGPTAVQPLARTDKVYLDRAAEYLSRQAETERTLVSSMSRGSLQISTGSVGLPLIYYPIQHLIGAAAGVSTLSQNYVSAIMKMAERELNSMGSLSPTTQELLSLLNVTRIINLTPSSMGLPANIWPTTEDGPLGRVIRIEEASPIIYAGKLVELPPPPGLDKPFIWDHDFSDPKVTHKLNGFILQVREVMQYDPRARFAKVLPVRKKDVQEIPEDQPYIPWRTELIEYRVGVESVLLKTFSERDGFARVSHPWYPFLRVTHNGKEIQPLQSALNFMVVPVTAGLNEYRIEAIMPSSSRVAAQVSFLALICTIGLGLIGARVLAVRSIRGRRD
jgi:hypothetical protein